MLLNVNAYHGFAAREIETQHQINAIIINNVDLLQK